MGGRKKHLLVVQAVPVPTGINGGDAQGPIRALRESIAAARGQADVVLLDTAVWGSFGGSGVGFAWHLAREAADSGVLLVAGGLTPHNVRSALEESGAWGVDVSSGVEVSPGVKDPALLRRLFAGIAGAGGIDHRKEAR
jgi:phosphoribosylanthranilate isomerase